MQISRSAIKRNAKLSMRSHKPSVYLVTLVYLIIVAVLNALITRLNGSAEAIAQTYNLMLTGDQEAFIRAVYSTRPGTLAQLLVLAIQLMSIVLAAGYTIFGLNVSRSRRADYGSLFDGFALFGKILWLSILQGIFVFLWSLLLVIPGIIAAYRYRQSLYILLDHPELSALECIRASKLMMNGHKGELFVLDLSFIGWNLLAVIPLVSLYVSPYTEITYANYYNALAGLPVETGSPDGEAGGYDRNRDPWDR